VNVLSSKTDARRVAPAPQLEPKQAMVPVHGLLQQFQLVWLKNQTLEAVAD
jgi:hypothetical protein